MKMTQEVLVLKSEKLDVVFNDLKKAVVDAIRDNQPVHEIERTLWREVRRIGREALALVFSLLGNGDQGEDLELPDGRRLQRLEQEHRRVYQSIFGPFELSRVVYGSREGQKIEFVPLDHRLQLPEGVCSYVLQDWDQSLCVEQAFGQTQRAIGRILDLRQSVDGLEHMNQQMAEGVTTFMLNRPQPSDEGEIVVASADQKGIVMRRNVDDPPPTGHRTKGDKASRKRMATVATVYTVDRHVRTAEEVVAALFRDRPKPGEAGEAEGKRPRPKPQHKEVWATLPRDETPGSGIACAFAWIVGELFLRGRAKDNAKDGNKDKPLAYLSDGQEALWEARREWLPARGVDILDLLHVTPRLWKAAHVFHREGSPEAEAFVRERVLRVLQGKASGVIRGLREMATKHELTGAKKRTIASVCRYLEANLDRMHYDEYLREGYPIASGAVEGACRNLVKDRMERAGMHWTLAGAQAMLDVRSIHVSGLWDEYQNHRIERESSRLYPYHSMVTLNFGLAA
jgi:hypothetical protein